MKSFIATLLSVTLIPSVLGQLSINTPSNVIECEPFQFDWSGGVPPYFLSLLPGQTSSAAAIKLFPQQSGTAFTWDVDLPAGTTFTAAIKDSDGNQAFSAVATIDAGTTTSCQNTAVQDSGNGTASGSSGSAPSSSGSTSPSATSPSGSSSSTSTSSASTTSKTSAARADRMSVMGGFAVAGAMGLIGAALF